MDNLSQKIEAIQAGDVAPFSDIVRAFQDMAVGYSFSILNDFHLAEDASQEAFVTAYLQIRNLKKAEAFPGWFKRIVFTQCGRITRRKRERLTSEMAEGVSDGGQETALIQKEEGDRLIHSLSSLPEEQRVVVALTYINAFSQQQIADFLEISVSTVNNRVHRGRLRLKEELLVMSKTKLEDSRPSNDDQFVTDISTVVSAISSIDRGDIPALKDLIVSNPDLVHTRAIEAVGDTWYHQGYFAGATLLHHVAGNPIRHPLPENIVEVARVLLVAGAEVDAETLDEDGGTTTLGLVASGKQAHQAGVWRGLIDVLLEYGADLNRNRSAALYTSLYHTQEHQGQREVAAYVRSHGAQIDLAFAAALGELDAVRAFFKPKGSLDSLAYSCHRRPGDRMENPSEKDVMSEAFVWACFNNRQETAAFLVEQGADLHAAPAIGGRGSVTALHRVCLSGWAEMAEWLLSIGADADRRDDKWNSPPASWAAAMGHTETVKVFADRGQIDREDAIRAAENGGHQDVVDLLRT
jgi:RNA polymerase sigma factor (sigma-70 family)